MRNWRNSRFHLSDDHRGMVYLLKHDSEIQQSVLRVQDHRKSFTSRHSMAWYTGSSAVQRRLRLVV